MNSKEREIQRAKEVSELLQLVKEIHAKLIGPSAESEEEDEG